MASEDEKAVLSNVALQLRFQIIIGEDASSIPKILQNIRHVILFRMDPNAPKIETFDDAKV